MSKKIYFRCNHPLRRKFNTLSYEENVQQDFSLSHVISIRDLLNSNGISLTDNPYEPDVIAELHENAFAEAKRPDLPLFGYAAETEYFWPLNYNTSTLRKYKAFYHFDDRFLRNVDWLLKTTEPRHLTREYFESSIKPWNKRQIFCSGIFRNKNYKRKCHTNGYEERVRFIENYIHYFDGKPEWHFALYGAGWNFPPKKSGYLSHIFFRINEQLAKLYNLNIMKHSNRIGSVWQGTIHRKEDVLSDSKFSLAIENVYYRDGYVTEKLFDCMRAGSVPITKGDPVTTFEIPRDLYINIDDFGNYSSLFRFLEHYNQKDYDRWLIKRDKFIMEESWNSGSSCRFAANLAGEILKIVPTN
jgi:hypothetical protein